MNIEQERSAVLKSSVHNDAVLSVQGPHCPGSETLDIRHFGGESIVRPPVTDMHFPEVIFSHQPGRAGSRGGEDRELVVELSRCTVYRGWLHRAVVLRGMS